MERIAIVGTGIAGLGCAWNLRNHARIQLIEKNPRPGGHTNTVRIQENGRSIPIDTGFIVFNQVTYPNLCRLFSELDVPIKPSEMSFSVQHLPTGLEYNGMGFTRVFAQKRNLLNPKFLLLLRQIFRFFRIANESLNESEDLTLGEFVGRHRLGTDFLNLYLVPMSSAVWSTEPARILDFPATTLIRFFHNHGFLGVSTHHPWFTVDGGAQTYVEKILSHFGKPVTGAGVSSVEECSDTVRVALSDGSHLEFDRVVLACHADEALAVIKNPSPPQQNLLAPFRYQENVAQLHTWPGVMPSRKIAWASWNYRVEKNRATTHYWMNALQNVSPHRNYFVSLNSADAIPPEHVLYSTTYHHPVFNLPAIRAQSDLPSLNRQSPNQRLFFCGSYFKYGFHEDAYSAGIDAARAVTSTLDHQT